MFKFCHFLSSSHWNGKNLTSAFCSAHLAKNLKEKVAGAWRPQFLASLHWPRPSVIPPLIFLPTPTPQMIRWCHCSSSSISARPSFLSPDVVPSLMPSRQKALMASSLTLRRLTLHLCHRASKRCADLFNTVGILWAPLHIFPCVSRRNSSCLVTYIVSSSAQIWSDDQSSKIATSVVPTSSFKPFISASFLWWQRDFFFTLWLWRSSAGTLEVGCAQIHQNRT